MSGHATLAKFGWIEFEGQKYTLLTQLLDERLIDKIDQFKKENRCGWSTVSWMNFQTGWRIEENRLLLVDVHISFFKRKENLIEEIFGQRKIFVTFSGKAKLLKSERIVERIRLGKVLKKLDIIELYFDKGRLVKKVDTSEMKTFVNFQDFVEP